MKNSLALLAAVALLVGSSGCGCCRGLCKKPAAPAVYSQCAPSCGPTCSAGGSCGAGGCGCQTGTPVTYGFNGGAGVAMPAGTPYESAPMTFPAGSGSYGQ